jgi:hypothetical protein
MTDTVRLTGKQLLDYVDGFNLIDSNLTEMVRGAGYVHDNGTPAYVYYYTEVLRAQGE